MEFLSTVNLVPGALFFISIGVLVFILFVMTMMFRAGIKPLSISLEVVLQGMIFALIIPIFVSATIWVFNARDGKEHLEHNLKEKYEIASVDYDSEDARVRISKSEKQLILVNLEDGKQASFLLTQNKETNEPTLTEVPGDSNVTVEAITR